MTVRIGWSNKRSTGEVAGGIGLFRFLKVDKGKGRYVVVGLVNFRREDLERLRNEGTVLDVRVIGVLRLERDVTPHLASDALGRVRVTGKIVAPSGVVEALAA